MQVTDGSSSNAVWRGGAAGAVLAIVVVAAVAAFGYATGWRLSRQPVTASCVADDAIEAGTRKALDPGALDFVNTVSGSNPIGAYAMLADDTKGAVTPDKFLAALRPSLEPIAPFSDVRVAHAYFVHAPATGANQRVICGNLDRPDHWVAVTAKPIAEQAHL